MLGVGPTEACRIGEVGSHVPAPCGIRPRWRRPELENGAMNFLHRITGHFEIRRKQAAIHGALARLDARALADLGLEPGDIATVARLGSRLGPDGAHLSEIVARVRAAEASAVSRADRLFAALQRMSARKAATLAYTPSDLDRYIEDAHRLRAETIGLAVALARPGPGRPVPAGRAGSARIGPRPADPAGAGMAPRLPADARRARDLLGPRADGRPAPRPLGDRRDRCRGRRRAAWPPTSPPTRACVGHGPSAGRCVTPTADGCPPRLSIDRPRR